jgi:hypothetical protein
MRDYSLDATHFMPSRDLYLIHCKFDEHGKLISAEVVNGAWLLKLNGDNWNACDFFGNVVTVMPAYPEDFDLEFIRELKGTEIEYEDNDDDIPF